MKIYDKLLQVSFTREYSKYYKVVIDWYDEKIPIFFEESINGYIIGILHTIFYSDYIIEDLTDVQHFCHETLYIKKYKNGYCFSFSKEDLPEISLKILKINNTYYTYNKLKHHIDVINTNHIYIPSCKKIDIPLFQGRILIGYIYEAISSEEMNYYVYSCKDLEGNNLDIIREFELYFDTQLNCNVGIIYHDISLSKSSKRKSIKRSRFYNFIKRIYDNWN